MSEIGSVLREAREAQGLSLMDVERETRIRRAFLQALEEERFDALPGDVYARGFIRNYALFLGLDPQPLLDAFNQVSAAPRKEEPMILNEPLQPQRASIVGAQIFLIIMAVIVLFFVGWFIYSQFYGGPNPSDVLYRLGIQTRFTTTPTRVQPSGENLPTAQPSETATLGPTATYTPSPTAPPTRTALPTRTPTAIKGILVQADIVEDSWLYVVADGEVIYNELATAGANLTWQAENLFSISVGNAGGVNLTVNHVPLGILGASGEVMELNYTLDTLPTPSP